MSSHHHSHVQDGTRGHFNKIIAIVSSVGLPATKQNIHKKKQKPDQALVSTPLFGNQKRTFCYVCCVECIEMGFDASKKFVGDRER
jgi:hypothetical protein